MTTPFASSAAMPMPLPFVVSPTLGQRVAKVVLRSGAAFVIIAGAPLLLNFALALKAPEPLVFQNQGSAITEGNYNTAPILVAAVAAVPTEAPTPAPTVAPSTVPAIVLAPNLSAPTLAPKTAIATSEIPAWLDPVQLFGAVRLKTSTTAYYTTLPLGNVRLAFYTLLMARGYERNSIENFVADQPYVEEIYYGSNTGQIDLMIRDLGGVRTISFYDAPSK